MELEKGISAMRAEKRRLQQVSQAIESYYSGELTEKKARAKLAKLKCVDDKDAELPAQDEAGEYARESRGYASVITARKEHLVATMDEFDGVRRLREEFVADRNVVSLFESTLTRTLGIQTGELTKDLLIVKTCYFKVLRDIVENGFIWGEEKYVYFTASAGQIRTKRSVFIRESQLEKYAPKLMCGLSVDRINEMGGVNTNKYLAYLALCNSATDPWPEFDIRKTIVVEDMETEVESAVDYIDPNSYQIERRVMRVPITHTDGCGMVRPDISKKNFMVRLPWVKGLLISFPFDKFIREANRAGDDKAGTVVDIYGVEHDVLAEDIQIIFTKSQFKMYKYYQSWAQYQGYYEQYGCETGVCNVEPDHFDGAKINYQMLQTLKDLTDAELLAISAATTDKLKRISSDRQTMLQMFGATNFDERKSGFQKCLRLYPELLQDEFTRRTLRDIRKSIETEARAGKLYVDGYYTFIAPDMYAFCQYLFLGELSPRGLLDDGEVYCSLFEAEKLDCLRAPHLSMEHAVRRNLVGTEREAEIKRWFKTPAVYTSTHDVISKILMFDEKLSSPLETAVTALGELGNPRCAARPC